MTNPALFWDRLADRYARQPIRDLDAYHYTLDRTRSYLHAQDHVLELGCGTSSTALLLAGNVQKYVATDLSPRMIEIGREKAKKEGISNVEFVAADICDPQLAGTDYNAVLALNLLHLLPDLPAALRQIHKITKPGGLFISKTICVPETGWPFKYKVMKLALPVMQMFGKAPFVDFMRIHELERRITDAGFDIIESGNHPVMPPGRYLVARKR